MAQQLTILRHRRRNSASKVVKTFPQWYPFSLNEDEINALLLDDMSAEKLNRLVTKVQAVYRGYRARTHTKKLFIETCIISAQAVRDVSIEIKNMHTGWKLLCNHLILLVFLSAVAYVQLLQPPPSHSMNGSMHRLLEDVTWNGGANTFSDVKNVQDVVQYVYAFLEAAYRPDPLYEPSANCTAEVFGNMTCPEIMLQNKSQECTNITEFSGYMDNFNRIQFGLYLTQERRVMTDCFETNIDLYTDILNAHNSEHNVCATDQVTSTFIPARKVAVNESLMDLPQFRDSFDEYDVGVGFYHFFDIGVGNVNNKAALCEAQILLDELRWVDRATKKLCIFVLLHNANECGRFGEFGLCFDFTLGGDVEVNLEVDSGNILKVQDQTAAIVLTAVYAVLVASNIIYFALRLYRLYHFKSKRKSVSVIGLIVETVILTMNLCCIIFYSLLLQAGTQLLAEVEHVDAYSFFTEVVESVHQLLLHEGFLKNFYCVLLVFMVIRTIQFMDFHPDIAIVSRTIGIAGPHLLTFAVVYFLIVCLYAFIGFILFEAGGNACGTFGECVSTLLFVSMAEFGNAMDVVFNEFLVQNTFVTQIYFWSYLFLTTLILFNILLSIVVDAYVTFMEATRNRKSLGFASSFIVHLHIIYYDCKHFYWKKLRACFCCTNNRSGESLITGEFRNSSSGDENNVVQDKEMAGGDNPRILTYEESFQVYSKEMAEEVASLINKPHRYLTRLKHLRNNCNKTIPTFVLRHEFNEVFPQSLTERLLCILRDRTHEARPNVAQLELDLLYRHSEAFMHSINLTRQLLVRVETISKSQRMIWQKLHHNKKSGEEARTQSDIEGDGGDELQEQEVEQNGQRSSPSM